ncbi:MAG: ABC transporter substrate-binding protein, partial [Verrucomicrobiota bacterium]|nr:ABC transporter substrate-binding protein [Verrucomicrobiota bacterium]
AAVAERIGRGRNLYEVDERLLQRLAPTHILTQELCQVCAPSGNEITRALAALPVKPQILWFTPHGIEDIFDNLRQLGRGTGRQAEAEKLIAAGRARLERISELTKNAPRPRVFCLEWIDPYYCCGHWVPEMVELAGGRDALGRQGADSVRISWKDVAVRSPEILIVSPCGFDLEKAVEQTRQLLRRPGWSDLPAVRNGRVFAVNANAYFARPGPRVVDGVELLAHLIHPERCGWNGPGDALQQVQFSEMQPWPARIKICRQCGAEFSCGPQPAKGHCWCDELPPFQSPAAPDADCLCPKCLRAEGGRPKVAGGGPSSIPRPSASGFTLVELLAVIAVLGVLAALLLPALARSKLSAQRAVCVNNLHQLGLAAAMYCDDNHGDCFRYIFGATNYGQIYWFGWLGPGPEGERPFDQSLGALHPYLGRSDVRLCPALNYALAEFKLKADGAAYGYGYNLYLSASADKPPVKIGALPASEIALFADAAQVNDFQAPASPSHPMLEEFYYLDVETNYSSPRNYPNGHFRHARRANVVFCDGHVAPERPVPGSIDRRLPGQFVGQLPPEILQLP